MDIDELTWDRDDVDRWMRTETGVDLLRGQVPRTRLVCFDRRRPLLAARSRAIGRDEDWVEHASELLFLARSLRPAAVAVGFTMRPTDLDDPDAHLTLVVATGVRRLFASPMVEVRTYPYRPGPAGLLAWAPASGDGDGWQAAAALPRAALRRPSWRVARFPHVVAHDLGSRGHHLDAVPAVAARLHLDPAGSRGAG